MNSFYALGANNTKLLRYQELMNNGQKHILEHGNVSVGKMLL
jgi:hypothetical protein